MDASPPIALSRTPRRADRGVQPAAARAGRRPGPRGEPAPPAVPDLGAADGLERLAAVARGVALPLDRHLARRHQGVGRLRVPDHLHLRADRLLPGQLLRGGGGRPAADPRRRAQRRRAAPLDAAAPVASTCGGSSWRRWPRAWPRWPACRSRRRSSAISCRTRGSPTSTGRRTSPSTCGRRWSSCCRPIVLWRGACFALGRFTGRPIVVFLLPIILFLFFNQFLWHWFPPGLDPSVSAALRLLDPSGFRWFKEHWLFVDRGIAFYNTRPVTFDAPFLLQPRRLRASSACCWSTSRAATSPGACAGRRRPPRRRGSRGRRRRRPPRPPGSPPWG